MINACKLLTVIAFLAYLYMKNVIRHEKGSLSRINQPVICKVHSSKRPYTGVEVDPSFFGFERFLLLASSDWAMLPTVGTRGLWLRRAWKVAVTAALRR